MIQLEVNGVFLDLYELDPPKITFNIEDIEDTSAKSIFSRTFRLPATSNNNQFFQHAFLVNGVDFDITIKRTARILVDGILFREGEIRLNKIYTSRENERIDYECIFLGETKSLGSSIGEKTLCDINTSDLAHELNYTAITESWQAYPEGTTTDGLLNGNVLYPIVDFGNTYGDGGIEQTRIGVGSGEHFTNPSNPLLLNRFKPMVRAKYIWDKIFDDAGFTYTSTFLGSDLFNQLYVSAWGDNEDIEVSSAISNYFRVVRSAQYDGYYEQDIDNPDTQVDYNGEVYDYSDNYNLSTDTYTAPVNGTYQFAITQSLYIDNETTGTDNLTFIIKKNGTIAQSVVIDTFFPGDADGNYYYSHTFPPITLVAGDTIQFWINPLNAPSNVVAKGGSFTCIDAPGDMDISYYLNCDTKQIDFIKHIINKFRLVLSPDKNISSNFIIEPWADFIASGDIFDWTNKLDVSKDFTIEPLFYTQKSKITFTDKEDGDYLNDTYKKQFDETFGTLEVFDANELLTDERKVEGLLPATPVQQIEGANQFTGGAINQGMDNFIIPLIHTHDETGNHIPMKPKTRLLFYNGLKDTGLSVATTNTYNIQDESLVVHALDTYPMISEYSVFPINATSLYLNWERELGYIRYGVLDYNTGASVYEDYWSDYINLLYNKWSRKITAYFILDSTDLQDFSFDDVIFVKDTYYYVDKIYDVPIGDKTSVKVDLIKLIDFSVPTGGIIPLGNIWDEVSDDWDTTTFTWND